MEDNYYDQNDKDFFEFAQKLSDRQLLEKQTHYQYLQAQYLKSIMKNVAFFFYLSILGSLVAFVIFMETIK